jgi:hypothetical protein
MTGPQLTRAQYLQMCRKQMWADLTYPVDKDGNVMDAGGVRGTITYHLVRAGWRKPNNTDGLPLVEAFDDPLIKRRKVYGPGVYEDAVTWVAASDPDDPLERLADMTMAQIEALAPDVRLEARRRLGMAAEPAAVPQPAGWTVQTHITIADEPDVDDGTVWT